MLSHEIHLIGRLTKLKQAKSRISVTKSKKYKNLVVFIEKAKCSDIMGHHRVATKKESSIFMNLLAL